MSTKTQSGIFTFDHGQKKLHNAIGVQESYLNDLEEQVMETIKNFLFDENKNLREDASPSQLVEQIANEYSYSQIVIMASMFLTSRLKEMETKLEKISSAVKTISLNSDDLPQDFKDFLEGLARQAEQDGDGDDD